MGKICSGKSSSVKRSSDGDLPEAAPDTCNHVRIKRAESFNFCGLNILNYLSKLKRMAALTDQIAVVQECFLYRPFTLQTLTRWSSPQDANLSAKVRLREGVPPSLPSVASSCGTSIQHKRRIAAQCR